MSRRTLLVKLALLLLGVLLLAGHQGWFHRTSSDHASPVATEVPTPTPPPVPLTPATPAQTQPDPMKPASAAVTAPARPAAPQLLPIPADGELRIDGVEVTLLAATAVHRGDILMLPGWNFERTRWCTQTRFCTLARAAGFRLVLPEMGKSVYSSAHFPETKPEWKRYPTLPWVTQLLPELKARFGIFSGPHNFLVGLSTGARGVVLIAQATGDFFTAGAALSGDYDQTRMPTDRLMTGFYGSFQKNRERWRTRDNPTTSVEKLTIPVYFGHGLADPVVPASQTLDFYERIRQTHPDSRSRLHRVPAGHDFAYWDSETKAILDFFIDYLPGSSPPAP